MHRVLEIPELQLAIAQELIPPESHWYRRRTDLYRLSLVSHSWRSVAEPMRWEEGSDLEDILCILPEDAWVRVNLEDTDWQGNTIMCRARVRDLVITTLILADRATIVSTPVDMPPAQFARLENTSRADTLCPELYPEPGCRDAADARKPAEHNPACRHALSEADGIGLDYGRG